MTDVTAAPTDLFGIVRQTISQQTDQANALVAQINAAKADNPNGLVHQIVFEDMTVTDTTVLAFREWVEKLDALRLAKVDEISEYAKGNLMPETGDFDADAAAEKYKALRTLIRNGQDFIKGVPGYDAEAFASVPNLASLRGGTVSSGGTTDQRRPRVDSIWVDGVLTEAKVVAKDKSERMVSNFTIAAAYISKASGSKVEVKDLQASAFAGAGTDDLKSLNGRVFEFSFSSGEKNYAVKVLPTVAKSSEPVTVTEAVTEPTE